MTGKECLTQQASNPDNEGFDFFNFTVTAEGSGHIANVKDLFRLGSKYNTTYEGKTQVCATIVVVIFSFFSGFVII